MASRRMAWSASVSSRLVNRSKIISSGAVDLVAHQVQAGVVEVGADLVLAPGAGVAGHERHRRAVRRPGAAPAPRTRCARAARPAVTCIRTLTPLAPVSGERRLDLEAVLRGVAVHERQVGLLDPPGGEGGLERPGVLRRASAGQQAGGLPVEPVGRVDLAGREGGPGQRREGVLDVARGGVDREAGRLVDHEQLASSKTTPNAIGVSGSGSASFRSANAHPGRRPGWRA